MRTPDGRLGYSSYCNDDKSKRSCKNAGLSWESTVFSDGCGVGDWETKDPAAKREIGQFENGCGGRQTYKCY